MTKDIKELLRELKEIEPDEETKKRIKDNLTLKIKVL